MESTEIMNTLEKVLRQPCNALMLQFLLSLRNKLDYVNFASLFLQQRRSFIYLKFCEYFLLVEAIKADSLALIIGRSDGH